MGDCRGHSLAFMEPSARVIFSAFLSRILPPSPPPPMEEVLSQKLAAGCNKAHILPSREKGKRFFIVKEIPEEASSFSLSPRLRALMANIINYKPSSVLP